MSRELTKLCCALALLLLWGTASAQSPAIVGRVVDSGSNPLIGVAVVVKGTTTGTITDTKGNYSIAADSNQTLQFTYLGYQTSEQAVGTKTVINVTLLEDVQAIDAIEVVSDGFSTIARRDLTGSVATADMGDIMKSNVTSFDQAIGGRIAGVVVTSADGAVGQEATITIRGNNSITQSSEPLYVIDGFPTEASFASSINMADIESYDILKDASATAIYGARGANGVIVITTKQGKARKPTVSFSGSVSPGWIANKADLMGPYDFVVLQRDINEERGGTYIETFNNSYLKDRTLEDYKTIPGYDWQDEVYRTAVTQNYNVSLSGGAAGGTRYNVTFSALDQQGIIVKSNFQRYQGKVSLIQPINKWAELNLNVNYTNSAINGVTPTDPQAASSQSGWLIYSIWGYRPVTPSGSGDLSDELYDPDVTGTSDYRFNPAVTVRNEYRKTIRDYVSSNGALTFTLTKDLKLKVSGGYIMNNSRAESFNGTKTYTGYPGSSSGKGVNGSIYWYEQSNWQNDNTLTWNKKFGKDHNLNAMGGISLAGESRSYNGTAANQITSETLGLQGMNTGMYQTVTPYLYQWRLMSFLARANYNYKYKYYLTASFRADGSSKFPSGNRWGYFPSVGASWNFSREDFVKPATWLSNGKLRVSWGRTGNNRTKTPYDFYPQITTTPGSSTSVDYVFGGERMPGYYFSNMGDDKLKWETTDQLNAGTDLGFLHDRIKVTFDWYLKNTHDLLLYAAMPLSTGYTNAMMNIGEIRNKGIEFTLETVNILKQNFSWSTSFNIARNRNTIESLVSGQQSMTSTISWAQEYNNQPPYISVVGGPTGLMYGMIYEGTYKDSDFLNGVLRDGVPYLTSVNKTSVRPGDPKYRDMNGDGVVDDYDRTVIGRGQPLFTGGMNNTLNYKNFDLNIFMSWSYGNDILNVNRLVFENGIKSNTNALRSYNNRWSAENPGSNIPRVGASGTEIYSSRVVEDGSFLKIKNISLGYTLPANVLKKMRIATLRVYVSADNMFTFTNYSGPDPEVSTRPSVLTPGFDWSAYPRAKSITAGVNITF